MLARIAPALRLMRGPLLAAAVVAAASIAYIWYASGVVQQQLDAAGTPGCLDPNVCYPHGAAMDAVFRMELIAAFVPLLIGLILGVPLLRKGVPALGVALVAGAVLTGAVATTHRVVGARYTVLANDTYELLEMLHLNHPGYMVAITLVITALGAVFGVLTGRVLPTLVRTVVAWPFALITAYIGVGLISWPLAAIFGDGEGQHGLATNDFSADIGFADGVGYAATVVLAVGTALLVLAARRQAGRLARA